MGDHFARTRRQPPGALDRADQNATRVVVNLVGLAMAIALFYDAIAVDWYVSYSIQYVPVVTAVTTGVLLLGSAPTLFGILFRPRRWKPLGTILLEFLGCVSLFLGWASFALAVWNYSPPGTTATLLATSGMSLAALWEAWVLLRTGFQIYHEAESRKETRENIRKARGA